MKPEITCYAIVEITHRGDDLPGTVRSVHAGAALAYASIPERHPMAIVPLHDLDTARGVPPQVGLRVRFGGEGPTVGGFTPRSAPSDSGCGTFERAHAANPCPGVDDTDVRPLDTGIARYVTVLRAEGVETSESCQGGEGHPFPVPTIRFHGGQAEGCRALGIALQHALPVSQLRRVWDILDGEPTGPQWEMTFVRADGAS